jgi:tripartite-type tricarboxylate transporter receptor subunit TctC
MQRRILLGFGVASLVARQAHAAEWPERPVRIVVPYAPGGPVDAVARMVGDRLAARFDQSFVIDNKPGANGAIGVQAVMAAPADGYTLLMHGSAGTTIYPAIMRQPVFDTLRDLTPITPVVLFDIILCANPALPFKTVKEFVAYAKANPGKLSYGSAGVGAMNHVGAEWFRMMTGIDIVHVPYRGDAPVATDVANGTLGVAFVSSNVAIPLIQAGKLRALAVPSRKRVAILPDLPTIAEAGFPDFDLQPSTSLFGPAQLDKAIVARLSLAVKEILAQPEIIERFRGLGMTPAFATPEEFTAPTCRWSNARGRCSTSPIWIASCRRTRRLHW